MPTSKQHRFGLKGREFSSNNVVENIHTSSQLDVIPGDTSSVFKPWKN